MILRRFFLPFPPSVNTPYRMRDGKRCRHEKVLAWHEEASKYLNKQNVFPVNERVEIIYNLYVPDKRVRDAGNYEKTTTDFLVARNIIADDSRRYLKSVWSRWTDESGNMVEVIIVTPNHINNNI